jgi:hypothetical protein
MSPILETVSEFATEPHFRRGRQSGSLDWRFRGSWSRLLPSLSVEHLDAHSVDPRLSSGRKPDGGDPGAIGTSAGSGRVVTLLTPRGGALTSRRIEGTGKPTNSFFQNSREDERAHSRNT